MESTLKKWFGYSAFRPYQKEIIKEVLKGIDCLVVMATGSGKSLCYQIPPLLTGKTAVVISPLLSLMQDQVMSLKQRGIKAEYLGSTQKDSTAQSNAESGQFHILYMTPEKACSLPSKFWTNLLEVGVCLFAVDEAHCISDWGHDFRKEYKQLDKLRGFLLNVPFIGLTATATQKVRMDIIRSLNMNDPYIAIGSFDRENLFYGVKPLGRCLSFVDELIGEISKYVASAGSTIIYCSTVKDAEQIFQSLLDAGIKAGIYHGQMGGTAREKSHRMFIRDELHVMVATVAFGMGIDKPNVRCVIHYGCPKSLEFYYQESGRCGRDGLPSICWLYYTRSDFAKADFYCGEAPTVNQRKAIMESLMSAQRYCMLATCRRKCLLEYFGEKITFTNCGSCDNCTNSKKERDMSREALLLLSCIQSCGGRWGLNMPIDILRGSRSKKIVDNHFDKLSLHGIGREYSSNWWKALGDQLMTSGYLKERHCDKYRTISVSPIGMNFLHTSTSEYQPPLVLPITSEMVDEEEPRDAHGRVDGDLQDLASLECEGLSKAEIKLYHMLLDLRMDLAKSTGTAPYAICGDQTIKKIANTRPSTKARLANVDGVNMHLVTTYGDQILQQINHFSEELNLSMDGEATVQTAVAKKVYPISNSQKKLAPAKFEAWKRWQEDGLTFQEIANFPGRAAPLKEQTVSEYILEAGRQGFEVNWSRLCEEIGLTQGILTEIQGAIAKVGSRERLKPIKEELPDHVSYAHIKSYLTMLDLHVLTEEILGRHQSSKTDATGEPSPVHSFGPGAVSGKKQRRSDEPATGEIPINKCHKVDITEQGNILLKATEGTILEWLRTQDGVALSSIIEHFKGSCEELVVDQLNNLESEFLIFRKKGLYRVM
ncbi:hypothetical protein MRB53_002313 [Persea americana]|uniref:Uncharacterized protein n=1 Tax=Persea americana TaxID=3435 RepID=A0ACC2MUE6_PERAE|nr:hypothetical protein MRB53_002313 [Persea americana]